MDYCLACLFAAELVFNQCTVFIQVLKNFIVVQCRRMSSGTLGHYALGSHGTSHQSQVWDTYLAPLVHPVL